MSIFFGTGFGSFAVDTDETVANTFLGTMVGYCPNKWRCLPQW